MSSSLSSPATTGAAVSVSESMSGPVRTVEPGVERHIVAGVAVGRRGARSEVRARGGERRGGAEVGS